jgi:hypothetical protein
MGSAKTLIVKFRSKASARARAAKIRKLAGGDVDVVRLLFPGGKGAELGSLFEVTLRDARAVDRVIASLTRDQDIEYAHVPAGRQPL